MKNKYALIAIHSLVWILVLFVPLVSVYQMLDSFLPKTSIAPFVPVVILSLMLISLFYVNYLILIPKLFHSKKYVFYAISLAVLILSAVLFSRIVLYYINFGPDSIRLYNPLLTKVVPIARLNAFLMLFFVLIGSVLLSIYNRMKEIEQEKISAQLASLQSQINPHFLFNTLNNIYATAIDSSPQTAEMIGKLSQMMRYTMKETQKDFVNLKDEIDYVDCFIALQKLRLDSNVKLSFEHAGNFSDFQIAPMLLIPFVENAFKHGVNSEENSVIKVEASLFKNHFVFKVKNLKVKKQFDISEHSGIGISNTKKRLELLYGKRQTLDISESERDFKIMLTIDL